MVDYSFLRLKENFNEAKSDMMIESEYFYNGGICLHPSETYLQITNSNTSIAFDESYKVELINCSGSVVKDITSKVYINEFQDNNGIYQIAFEILPILEDFYFERLYLKFTHTTSELILYSNGFFLTAEREKETFRLDYKSYREYKGTNYVLADYYQSVRLLGYYNGITETKDSKVYTEINGKIRKSRVIQSFEYAYNLEDVDTFTYQRLAVALENDLVYINGVKAEVLETLTASERKEKANIFDCNFSTQLDYSEVYTDVFQIAPIFNYTSLIPLGDYTLVTIPTSGVAEFNYNISYVSGNLKLYDYDTDTLLNELSISITDNYFSFTMPILPNGTYYFVFDNLVANEYGNEISITDKEIWKFKITNGDYSNLHYSNTNYFTN